eukprot:3938313-Rhodomonas_salina.1
MASGEVPARVQRVEAGGCAGLRGRGSTDSAGSSGREGGARMERTHGHGARRHEGDLKEERYVMPGPRSNADRVSKK